MSDIMHPISIEALLNWIFSEYQQDGTILAFVNFIMRILQNDFVIWRKMETPCGPAAWSSYTISTKYYCGLFNRFSFLKLRQSRYWMEKIYQ